jgi:hypothetical protein
MEKDSNIEIMRQVIEKKKLKSAAQGSIKRGPEDRFSTTNQSNKKQKKGGLPPK